MAVERITCIGCPLGCQVTLETNDREEVVKISGHRCKQGRRYVLEEHRNPVRVFTSTVLTEGSSQPLLPVRTNRPIPKTRLKEAAKALARARAKPPIKAGQAIMTDLLGMGADVIATGDLLT